jgi:hypothetical protein
MATGRSLTIANLIQQRQTARQQCNFATVDDFAINWRQEGLWWLTNPMAKFAGIGSKSAR